jgi:hypothetical protein
MQQQKQQTRRRSVPRMDETAARSEAEEFEERMQRARRAVARARRSALRASSLVSRVDRVMTHG